MLWGRRSQQTLHDSVPRKIVQKEENEGVEDHTEEHANPQGFRVCSRMGKHKKHRAQVVQGNLQNDDDKHVNEPGGRVSGWQQAKPELLQQAAGV